MPAASSSAAISAKLAHPVIFARQLLDALRRLDWVVYAKLHPSAGPEQVLAYLGRYTHRVAIANSRLVALDEGSVRFAWKDYRHGGHIKVMALEAGEFIRRFLLHTLPDGFHRIFVTTASWPMALAPSVSPDVANCSTCQPPLSEPRAPTSRTA